MYRVSTIHLTADATRADPTTDAIELGELSPGKLVRLLERFQKLEVIENHEADPYIEIHGRSGKFHVRTGRGKLFLYNARNTVEPYAELTPAEILIQLERDAFPPAPLVVFPEGTAVPANRPRAPQRAIAAAILAAGLLLNAYTVYSVTYVDSVNQKPDVILLTDAGETAARRTEIVGTYATGDLPGDRVITVKPNGRVEYSENGRKSSVTEIPDTYKIGRRGRKLCLVTGDGGVIDVMNIDTLVYFRDTYRRK